MATRTDEPKGSTVPPGTRLWRAVATLPLDRVRALREIETCFRHGTAPRGLDGPYRGRLIATTLGPGLDLAAAGAAKAWMPWRGKTFAAQAAEGRNIFTAGARPVFRAIWPGYRLIDGVGRDRITAFRFLTDVGPSRTLPEVTVYRIDYTRLRENPAWPIRRILDELVAVDDGLYLGQALLRWRGRWARVAWFTIEG